MSPDTPCPPPRPRTVTLGPARRTALAVVAVAGLAVAAVPGAQALASGHRGAPPTSAASQPVGGTRVGGEEGKGSRRGAPRTSAACGTFGDKNWWPFGNALHGSTVAETKDGGFASSYFQRGVVQSVSATTVTVLSKDSYLGTWTLADSTSVRRAGKRGADAALAVGQCVGVWGSVGTPTAPVARYVVITRVPTPVTSPSPSASPSTSPSASPSASPSTSPSVSPSASPSPSPSVSASATGTGSN